MVLTTPIIRCLKNQIAGSEIHYLTKKQFEPVIKANPYLSKIFTIDRSVGEVTDALRREKYDLIIDLHRNFRSAAVKFALQRRYQTFPKVNFRKWLLVNFKIDLLPQVHLVDRYFLAVNKLGVKNDQAGLDYFIPPDDQLKKEHLPELFRNGFVALVIGGRHATKQMPVEKLAELLRLTDKPVILLGGKEDEDTGQLIARLSGDHVWSGCGRYNINQSASILKLSRVVVTHDTGLMHIASAFRKPVISIWGNTVPRFGMYPYMPGDEEKVVYSEVKGLSCRPCSKLGYPSCPKKHFRCMNDQNLNFLISSLNRLWDLYPGSEEG